MKMGRIQVGNKENSNYKNRRRRKKLVGRFILTVFVIVFVFSAVFVLAATAFKSQRDKQEALNSPTKSDLDATIADNRINVAIIGTDEDEIQTLFLSFHLILKPAMLILYLYQEIPRFSCLTV